MDEKTEELRDIFIDTTGGDTVTERQEESRGSLADERDPSERVEELVALMREEYAFVSGLDDAALVEVVRRYHDGEDDDAIAAAMDLDAATVFDARMDLHLVRETDRDAPFELSRLRTMVVEDVPEEERAAALSVSEAELAHYTAVVHADRRSTRANDRFRDEFAELLTDSDLSDSYAKGAHEDGLREAAEDIETDVSF
ncbi:conditioned medium-induced protein 4 [Halobium salinum]|uniref:Conditioned medium-induced protein 4 n=1 Tax=Halobium salinum TaxID=1364940 RepID=A0ABD5P8G5_9EURY|nr:conditioned medium-induced protein 4 [Halobium salinum]